MSKLIISVESNISVELPNIEYSQDELQAIKDIQAILLASGVDKYIEIGLPNPRK
jgi:hypothetical protein